MRRFLLTGTALMGLLVVEPRPASALLGAGDTVFCLNCEPELAAALRWAQQATDMARQIQQQIAQLQQLQATYEAMTRVTDFGSAVGALSSLGIQNPFGVNPYAVQGLLNGTGGPTGMIGNVGSLFGGAQAANRIYETPGDTWLNQQINRNGGGIAGAQAMAMQLMQSAGERVPLLNELQLRINTAADPSEREGLIARFAAEQTYIQNASVQAQALENYMTAQFQSREQQREERLQQSIDEVLADARARGIY